MKVESSAHAHHDRIHQMVMRVHPSLLLGTTQPYPHNAGTGSIDHINDGGVFFRRQIAKGRRIGTHDSNTRKFRAEPLFETLEGARASAIEEHLGANRCCLPTAGPHQVRSADPLLLHMTYLPQHPSDRRPIGRNEISSFDRVCVRGIAARGDEAMHIADTDRSALALASPSEDAVGRFGPAQNIDRYAKHAFTQRYVLARLTRRKN